MDERAVLVTGIGGQGVQLAAQVLARGATLAGRHVLFFGVYAGAMRGMNTDATVIVGDAPIQSPPIVSQAWAGVAMHDKFWPPVERRLPDGGLAFVNDDTFAAPLPERLRGYRLDASGIAAELGNELAASMVLIGAFAGATGIVPIDALVEGMRRSIPSYRTQHIAGNAAAIRAGADAAPALAEVVG